MHVLLSVDQLMCLNNNIVYILCLVVIVSNKIQCTHCFIFHILRKRFGVHVYHVFRVSVSTTGIRSARRYRDERRIHTVQCDQTQNIHPSAKGISSSSAWPIFHFSFFIFLESRRNKIFAVDAGQIFDIPVDGIRKTNGNQTWSCPRNSGCRRRFQNIRHGFYYGKRIIYIIYTYIYIVQYKVWLFKNGICDKNIVYLKKLKI